MDPTAPPPEQPAPPQESVGVEIFQNSVWLIAQEVSDLLLAFAFTWIALRRLGPENFGLLTLTQAILNISGLATFNLELALIRLTPDFREQGLWRTVRQMVRMSAALKLALALVVALALFALAPLLAAFFQQPALVAAIRVGCLSLAAAGLADVGAAACLGLLHPEVRAAMTTVRRLVEVAGILLVSAIRLPAGGPGVADAVLVLAVADIVAALGYSLATLHHLGRGPQSAEPVARQALFRRMWNYALPLFGARLSDVGGREVGKLFLGRLASATALGYYSVARLAVERLMNLMSQAPLASVPVLARKQSQAAGAFGAGQVHRAALGLLRFQVLAANLLALVIWAAAPQFVLVLGGGAYTPAIPAMRLLSFAIVFWSATASLHALFLVRENTIGIFFLNTSQIVLTALFYLLLVPLGQATGAALSDSLAQVGVLLVGFLLVARWYAFPVKRGAKAFLLLSLPVLALVAPVGVFRFSLPVMAAWFVLAAGLYVSYLFGLDLVGPAAWDRLEKLATPFPFLNSLALRLSRLLRGYHAWIQERFTPPGWAKA